MRNKASAKFRMSSIRLSVDSEQKRRDKKAFECVFLVSVFSRLCLPLVIQHFQEPQFKVCGLQWGRIEHGRDEKKDIE